LSGLVLWISSICICRPDFSTLGLYFPMGCIWSLPLDLLASCRYHLLIKLIIHLQAQCSMSAKGRRMCLYVISVYDFILASSNEIPKIIFAVICNRCQTSIRYGDIISWDTVSIIFSPSMILCQPRAMSL
jgi:hypothetical protein